MSEFIEVNGVGYVEREEYQELEAELKGTVTTKYHDKIVAEAMQRLAEAHQENTELTAQRELVKTMLRSGYTDSFSNWVCPSENVFAVEQAFGVSEEENGR